MFLSVRGFSGFTEGEKTKGEVGDKDVNRACSITWVIAGPGGEPAG